MAFAETTKDDDIARGPNSGFLDARSFSEVTPDDVVAAGIDSTRSSSAETTIANSLDSFASPATKGPRPIRSRTGISRAIIA